MPKQRVIHISFIFYFLLAYLFFFLLKNPMLASDKIQSSLHLCYSKLIPSLFPFLVISDLIVSTGLSDILSNILGRPLSFIFHTKKQASSALLIGCLLGFPLGTKTAAALYEKQYITKKETEALICFCSNTGPAFILGISPFFTHNRYVGICIYVCQLLSAIIISFFVKATKNTTDFSYKQMPKMAFTSMCLPKSITSSVIPMLNICGFVCFFSCINASVENILNIFNAPPVISVAISGFLELTDGISKTNILSSPIISIGFASFFIGWSSLSVILQSICILAPHKINYKKYIVYKFIQGVLCAILSCFFCKLFNMY